MIVSLDTSSTFGMMDCLDLTVTDATCSAWEAAVVLARVHYTLSRNPGLPAIEMPAMSVKVVRADREDIFQHPIEVFADGEETENPFGHTHARWIAEMEELELAIMDAYVGMGFVAGSPCDCPSADFAVALRRDLPNCRRCAASFRVLREVTVDNIFTVLDDLTNIHEAMVDLMDDIEFAEFA